MEEKRPKMNQAHNVTQVAIGQTISNLKENEREKKLRQMMY